MQPRQLHLQMDLEDDSSVVTQADLALLDSSSSSSSSSKSDQALQVQGSNAQQPLAGDGGEDEEEPLTVGRKRNVRYGVNKTDSAVTEACTALPQLR